jgi:hypothetical protein
MWSLCIESTKAEVAMDPDFMTEDRVSRTEVNRVKREMALATTAVGYTSSEKQTAKQRAPGGGVDEKSVPLPSTKKLL